MNDLIDKYAARALQLSEQYDTGGLTFAELTDQVEEFVITFTEYISDLPELRRSLTWSAMEAQIETALSAVIENSKAARALNKIMLAMKHASPISSRDGLL